MWSLFELFPWPLMIDVLDVGASRQAGEAPTYQRLVDAGRARIVGFEPDAAECEALNREYGRPHLFLPYFVGDGEPATFHETNWFMTGSLFEPNTPLVEKFQNLGEAMQQVARHPVATKRLDDIPEVGEIDFIKIDVQGSELPIFRHASRVLSSALLVQSEVEFVQLYRGQPLFAEVDAFLRGAGFQFHTFAGFSGRAFKPLISQGDRNMPFRQLLWSDALYVSDWMNLERLAERKLQKYAVIAHDLLGSYDLAHLVLSELDRRAGSRIAPQYLERLAPGGAVPPP